MSSDPSGIDITRPIGYNADMAKAAKGYYVPPTVKQIMRWRVRPAANKLAYFLRLDRDKNTGWTHAPIDQLREEVGDVSSETIDAALQELVSIGALEAKPTLGVQLSGKEKRRGRSYRLHRPGTAAYKGKRKTTRRVKPAQPQQPAPKPATKPVAPAPQSVPAPAQKLPPFNPATGMPWDGSSLDDN